jgi:hypothetical protein
LVALPLPAWAKSKIIELSDKWIMGI